MRYGQLVSHSLAGGIQEIQDVGFLFFVFALDGLEADDNRIVIMQIHHFIY